MMSIMTEPQFDKSALPHQPILWIDGVGGYLLVDRGEVRLGQAVSGNPVDVGIVADISRQAAVLRRLESDYLLQPLQLPTRLNGELVDRAQLLTGQDLIQLGERVRLKFTRSNPLSATACLQLPGCGRFQPHVDGVLLLAESCILGPRAGSHVVCSQWQNELLLLRRGTTWYFRTSEELEVNGRAQTGLIPVVTGMRIRGNDFSLSIE